MSFFFEASLHCHLLFLLIPQYFYYHKLPLIRRFLVTTRTSNPFCATATANVIYRTWRFFQVCVQHCISLEVKWISRDLNVSADCISKLVDFDDYGLNDIVFQRLNHLWGPHTIDRFSCGYNAKLPRFNSRFFQPGCEAVDAFAQNWGYDNNWLCPPVCLIVRVIKHMELCGAQGTLVLPLWKSAFSWNVCARDGVHWNSFVVDWVYLPKFQGLFVPGKARNSLSVPGP